MSKLIAHSMTTNYSMFENIYRSFTNCHHRRILQKKTRDLTAPLASTGSLAPLAAGASTGCDLATGSAVAA